MTSRPNPRTVMREDLHELFHDYWNLLTAINSYVLVLRHSPTVQGIDREAADELSKLLPALERSMEAIRARVLSMTG